MSREQKCRACGCTENRACSTASGPCHWVEPDLCSACAPVEAGQVFDVDPADVQLLELMSPIDIRLDGISAFSICAALHLACRHPQFEGFGREIVEEFADGLAKRLSLSPGLAAVLAAGADPNQDRPRPVRLILPGDPDFRF